jgi:hypothetical protein
MVDELFPASAVEPSDPWRAARAPSPLRLLVVGLLRRLARVVQRAPARPAAQATEPLPTTMTGKVSGTRALADLTVNLTETKQAARRLGCTLNDLFLAAVTDGLRAYLSELPDVVVALVPRNVRATDDAGVIGNRAWSMLVPLPTGNPDPAARLGAIRAATESGKQLDSTSGTQGWRFDVALTNVAFGGPHAVAGRPVTSLRATVPLQGENRLVAVLLTHDDELSVSFTADGEAYSDVHRLAEATQAAWQRLLTEPAAVS